MSKTCSVCRKHKDYSFFRKDSSCLDGYRNKCRDCIGKPAPKKIVVKQEEPVENAVRSIYAKLDEKYPGHKCLVFGNGVARLQIHGREPNLHFHGTDAEEVLAKAI